MASQSLEGAEPCNNGDAALQSVVVSDQDVERTASSLSTNACIISGSPDKDHATSAPASPDNPVLFLAHAAPPEEAQKGEETAHLDACEEPLVPDKAMPMSMPSTVAVDTDNLEPASTTSTAAFLANDRPVTSVTEVEPWPADASGTMEAISGSLTVGIVAEDLAVGATPAREAVCTEVTSVDTAPLMEAVIVDSSSTLDSTLPVLMPSREATVEAIVISSSNDTNSVAVATMDSMVVTAADNMVAVDAELTMPVAMDSVVIETSPTDPSSQTLVSSPTSPKAGTDPPSEELNRASSKPEEDLPPEIDSIRVPAHWHPKPCVHISSIGGALTEEELLPLFEKYGPIASVSFENERHDAVLIRYDLQVENGDELLSQVREATNSTKLGDKTLIVEPFRPDSLLFVGNLTSSIDDASLCAMFEPHGKIERAFVLRNAEEQSKCYGFVEYSLKSQAMTAKTVMGNINMDGRVLRVEWSDCKRVEDMFSTVLFIDRIPREGPHIEGALKSLFGKFGRIRDSHLAVGTGNQIRGFGFIDFYHSQSADKAHQALDGHTFEGSNIRVSFANPSKSAQSYKFRYGAQSGQGPAGRGTGGSGMLMGPPSRGLSSRGPTPRGTTPMPLLSSRFMSPGRPGMMGFGLGMQFGRGPFDRGTVPSFHGSGRGMLGPTSFGAGRAPFMLGNMAPRAGMAVVENKLPFGQGPVSITPSAIVQVATAQARAREEEAKARAEQAARQGASRSFTGIDSLNHYQRFQHLQHQSHVQQQVGSYDQHYKQGDLYMHHQAQQAALQPQQQTWNQHSQQSMQFQRMPYHNNQTFPQQQHMDPNAQNDAYYQQTSQHTHQHGYASQYGQQQGYQYSQQAAQMYGQAAQQTGEQYQQTTQQSQASYSQHNYGEQYALQQQASQQSYSASAGFDTSAGVDAAQQQAYAAYYQQQAQAQAQATNPEAGLGTATSGTPQTAQQSYEAQWAAYYASQAAYQQQASSAEAGQKRSADQMETQNQAAYNYAGYPQQGTAVYQQQQPSQPSNESVTSYQMQAANSAAYQQQASYAATAYQQQGAANVVGYQQAGGAATYSASGQTGYEQSSIPAAEASFQQPAAAFQGQAGVYDYSKRPRF